MGMIGFFTPIPAGSITAVQGDPAKAEPFRDLGLDIDKSWHGVHYLLTGSAYEGEPPLSLMVFGGAELDDEGHRLLQPDEVKQVVAALPMPEVLRDRYDAQAMDAAEIYPAIWDEQDTALDYVIEYYQELADLYREAAGRGDGMLIAIG